MKEELYHEVRTVESFRKDWVVYIYNDDTTPIDVVIDMLVDVFDFDHHKAIRLAHEVNGTEAGIVGKYPEKLARARTERGMKFIHDLGYTDFKLEAKEEV